MALPKNSSEAKSSYVVDARVRIGHVHLKVSDIGRTLEFYCGALGFEITQRFGESAAFSFRGRLSPSFGGEYLGEASEGRRLLRGLQGFITPRLFYPHAG